MSSTQPLKVFISKKFLKDVSIDFGVEEPAAKYWSVGGLVAVVMKNGKILSVSIELVTGVLQQEVSQI